jgi:hypothetical protein
MEFLAVLDEDQMVDGILTGPDLRDDLFRWLMQS